MTAAYVSTRIDEVRNILDNARAEGKTIGLVPTMGALHEGHLTLVDETKRRADFVVATIFVNPTQFGPGEDLDKYPKDSDGDLEKLANRGVNLVFTPDKQVIYPSGFLTAVAVKGLTEKLCGADRPTHFAGVTTVVSKLFNIMGPCVAVFGRKDYQQLQVIKRMAADLNMPVEVVGVPTLREEDGLAMSSRNRYLSPEERVRGRAISQGLTAAHKLFNEGIRNVGQLRKTVLLPVEAAADSVDYVSAADPDILETIPDDVEAGERLLIAVAAKIGTTRLIDNTVLGEDAPPYPTDSPTHFK